MANYLLDTTVIIDYLRGKKEKVELVKKLVFKGAALGCCAINITEVYAGMKEKERTVTEEFLDSLEYYEISKEIAKKAGEYKRFYQKKGTTLSLSDVTIAAVAIYKNLILLTDNPKDYPLPGIKFLPHLPRG